MNYHSTSILAIESSTPRGSVSLWHGEKPVTVEMDQPQSQARDMLPSIERLLNGSGIWYDQLAEARITVGPGSFSGLRIGLSVARMIGFACPMVKLRCFTTLECVMMGYDGPPQPLMVVLPAGKGDVYMQAFEPVQSQWRAMGEIMLCHPDEARAQLAGRLMIGHGNKLLDASASEGSPPHASFLLHDERLHTPSQPQPKPLYIRAPDAKLPTKAAV